MTTTTNKAPKLTIGSDYEDYFGNLVRSWITAKASNSERFGVFAHEEIIVTAGPYRPSAVSFESSEGTLALDFYSALRRGFGELSESDIDELIKML